MKPSRLLVALTLLLAAGCRNKDELALQPYTNIPSGAAIVLRTKADAKDYTSIPARRFDLIMTNECVLDEIRDGTVWVSNYHGRHLGFAGSMVKSIEVREMPRPPSAQSSKP